MSHNQEGKKIEGCPVLTDGSELKTIMDILKGQNKDLEEIKIAVTGNTKLGIRGIVKQLEMHELEISALKAWKNNITNRVATVSGLVGGATFGVLEGFKWIVETFKHHSP